MNKQTNNLKIENDEKQDKQNDTTPKNPLSPASKNQVTMANLNDGIIHKQSFTAHSNHNAGHDSSHRERMILVPKNEPDSDTIILSAKPIQIQRKMSLKIGPAGIPILREIIVIETAASVTQLYSLLLRLFIFTLLAQLLITLWKRWHPKSCQIFITCILILFPPILLYITSNYLFLALIVSYDLAILSVCYQCLKRKIRKETVKDTYKFFKVICTATCSLTSILQVIVLAGYGFGLTRVVAYALVTMLTLIYLALLARETVEYLSGILAMKIGYYSPDGVPDKKIDRFRCAICDELISKGEGNFKGNYSINQNKNTYVVTLKCGHCFHEECIKGWLFLGKKDVCVCCKEVVDCSAIKSSLWEKGENLFNSFVDVLRKAIIVLAMLMVNGLLVKKKFGR